MQILSFLKYLLVAQVLKLFSLTKSLKNIYRILGNRYGLKNHSTISLDDISNGNWLVANIKKYKDTPTKELKALELGTGWVHFYSLYLKMFLNIKIDMFDIVDNRQFRAIQERFTQFLKVKYLFQISDIEYNRINHVVDLILGAKNFEELYNNLGVTYILNSNGDINAIPDSVYDIVFSVDVFEHISKMQLEKLVEEVYRILQPNGIMLHQIGIDDHLSHYATRMSSKNYLRYSSKTWDTFFNNDLQYINKLQLTDFIKIFSKNFELLNCESKVDTTVIEQVPINNEFLHYDRNALTTTRGYLIFRKK